MTAPSPRGQLEARAIRMLVAGDSVKDVAATIGLTREDVARLQRDNTPRRPTAAAVPTPPGEPTVAPTTTLPVRVLAQHPGNIRSDLGDLTDMAASIRSQGILQPLAVTRGERGVYVVVAGHRRLAAAILAELPRVPVVLRPALTDDAAVAAMLVENLQRASLAPLDEARAYGRLIEAGRTQQQIAQVVGVSQGRVSQRLALLHLTPAEQAALERKEITADVGYRTGRARSDRSQPHNTHRPKPKRVPHFQAAHPLAEEARALCSHETTLKLGPACGPCWEQLIRADERGRPAAS